MLVRKVISTLSNRPQRRANIELIEKGYQTIERKETEAAN